MDHKHGTDRNQMMIFSLESSIAPDSFVRVVDAFVDTIDMKSFGFAHVDDRLNLEVGIKGLIIGLILYLSFLATSELIIVIIDIEYNTRISAHKIKKK